MKASQGMVCYMAEMDSIKNTHTDLVDLNYESTIEVY